MRVFRRALAALPQRRATWWRYVPYDQLQAAWLPPPETGVGLLLVECPNKARRRPYHRQKLATVLSHQRHFALEAAAAGWQVRYVVASSYAEAVREHSASHGVLEVAEPAEYELREELAPCIAEGALRVIAHPGWLTEDADFDGLGGPPWRMDAFYRRVRLRTGALMENGEPVGGTYSFDHENRRPWRGEVQPPPTLSFDVDAITAEVVETIERDFADHPGRIDAARLGARIDDVEASWAHALHHALPWFGPFEDAFSTRERTLFHTRVSTLLNLGRLDVRRVLADVLAASLPIASQEGFVRQILGWREFVRHIHRRTHGMRTAPGLHPAPGRTDGGWSLAFERPWASASPSDLARARTEPGVPMPPAFWGHKPSGMRCLDHVVQAVWDEGYTHHIARLMILGNLATLLRIDARDLTDWFWCAFTDAYDWVVEPNVLGMASYATPAFTTKPYVAGSAYLDRMGDACKTCRLNPKTTCPITAWYWAYLADHADTLRKNPRMAAQVAAALRRPSLAADRAAVAQAQRALAAGQPVPAMGTAR
jgi:deoxyribodipyrimidine photolyase-related protein